MIKDKKREEIEKNILVVSGFGNYPS